MLRDLIDARRAELHERMEVAIEIGDDSLATAVADESAFILALLRELLDESLRAEGAVLAAEYRERLERQAGLLP